MAKRKKVSLITKEFRALIDSEFRAQIESRGSVALNEVHDVLLEKVLADPALINASSFIWGEIDKFDRNRRPKIDQTSFFDEEAIIPTGSGRRITMKLARPEDLLAWNDIILTQSQVHHEAYLRTARWISAKLTEFRANQDCETVGDLYWKLYASAAAAAA